MGTEWYVARDGETFGPFEFKVVVAAARSGELRKDDCVWRPGMEAWAGASTVTDLWNPPPLLKRFETEAPRKIDRTEPGARSARRPAITLKQVIFPSGRTNRRSFWGFLISAYFAGVTSLKVLSFLWPAEAQRTIGAMGLLAIGVLISAVIGRLHDHDRTGWYAVVYALPVALMASAQTVPDWQQTLWRVGSALAPISVIAMTIHIGFLRGTIGPNRFGPDPAEREHPDDFYTQARLISLSAQAWMPVFTVLGRTWVAVRWMMSKIGAHRLAAAMKGIEDKHEQGVQRNLAFAEQKGWHQVLRWHGRAVVDPRLCSFSVLSLIGEVITAIFVVPAISALLVLVLMFLVLPFFAPDQPSEDTTFLIVFVASAVIVAPSLLWLRIRKAKARETAIADIEFSPHPSR